MVALEKTMNSSATVRFQDELRIEVVHVKLDPAWGSFQNPLVGGVSRRSPNLLFFMNHFRKSSTLSVSDNGDNMCMAIRH